MKYVAARMHNGVRVYGYTYPINDGQVYWSMKFYMDAWHGSRDVTK